MTLVSLPEVKSPDAIRFPLERRARPDAVQRAGPRRAASSSCATRCSTSSWARRAAGEAEDAATRTGLALTGAAATGSRPAPGASITGAGRSHRAGAVECANAGPCRPAFAVPETRTRRDVRVVPW